MAANAARLNALIALNNKAMDMAEKNPFDDKAALRAHRSFTQAAQGKAGRKISMGVDVEAIEADNRVLLQSKIDKIKAERAKNTPKARNRLECPHCDDHCTIRSSRRMSKLTREYHYQCNNVECGHTFVASMEIRHTLSPSGTPDPSVVLPMPDKMRRDVIRAQMDVAPSVPYSPVNSKPVTGDLFLDQALPLS